MRAEEYIKACDEIEKRKLMLKYEYIESNTTIKPKTLVVVDGEIKWLQKYRIVVHHIHPIIYDVKDNYTPYISRTYVPNDYRTMRKLTAREWSKVYQAKGIRQ